MYWEADKECMDREELEQLQLERLQSTLNRVYAHVPFYRKKFDALGIAPEEIGSLSDLSRLPFTTKEDVRGNYPYGLFAVPLREVVRIHASSGTTETSSVVGYTRNDITMWSKLAARILVAGGVTKDDVVQVSFRYGLFTGGFGLHYGAERLGASVIPASSGNTARQIQIMKDFKTTALVSTPSYAMLVADTIREMGISGECFERNGLHINEDHFLVEVIDPKTLQPVPPGQTGELVITTLTKEAFPMVRYRTRDLTSLQAGDCPCGRTGRRMSRLAGRTDEMLIIRGMKVSPAKIESLLFEIEGKEPNYRIVIDRKGAMDEVTVLVEAAGEAPFGQERRHVGTTVETIRKRLTHELGVAVDVKLVEKKALEPVDGKAMRVIDNRKL